MEFFKKTATIFIIASGLIGSYFIIKNSDIENSGTMAEIKDIVQKTSETFAQNPIRWIDGEKKAEASVNITEDLSKIVFENIKAGKTSATPEEVLSEVFGNKEIKLDFVFDISDAELKISADNSKEAKKRYLETISEINKKNSGELSKIYLEIIVDVYQKLNVSSAKQAASAYNKLTADYLNVFAPSDWLDVHKALIIHYKNAATVYSAMSEYLNDPIKGYLALETIEAVANNGGQTQDFLNQKIKELNND